MTDVDCLLSLIGDKGDEIRLSFRIHALSQLVDCG
jgi:hypothetical protein